MSNYLVTGANGFIGRHLIARLLSGGHCVTALDRSFANIPSEWNAKVKIFTADITQKGTLEGVCRDIDFVIHLASKVHDLSLDGGAETEYFLINVYGTANLLSECSNSGIRHFVFLSSVKAMADEVAYGLDEKSQTHPTTPYGKSKLAAEKLIAEFGLAQGIATTTIRLPLVYGPGNKGNIYRMMAAVDKFHFVMIGRGNNKRSMVFVGNVIDALVKVTERTGADGKTYIVTDGRDYSVNELYRTIARTLDKRPLPFYVPMLAAKGLAKVGDVGEKIIRRNFPFNSSALEKLTSEFTFSSDLIQRELGFKPRHDLSNTIAGLVDWYRKNDRR